MRIWATRRSRPGIRGVSACRFSFRTLPAASCGRGSRANAGRTASGFLRSRPALAWRRHSRQDRAGGAQLRCRGLSHQPQVDTSRAAYHYLTELGYVSQRFEHPSRACAASSVAPTALHGIPNYLRAVTLLQPKGNLAAEVAAAVDRLYPPKSRGFRQLIPTSTTPKRTPQPFQLAPHPKPGKF